MKKINGFTLIELLAVIVILAIIAVIAVPIVLNIINDSKINANKRSIDMYSKALETSIATYQIKGNSLSGSFTTTDGKTIVNSEDETIKLKVDYSGAKVVCDTFEIYDNGNFYLDNCKVDDMLVNDYEKGEQQTIYKKFSDVCEPVTESLLGGNVPSGNYDMGDEYTCEVKEGTSYNFYVLSKEGNKVNLIMSSNIKKDGTTCGLGCDYPGIKWLSSQNYLDAGGELTDEQKEHGACKVGRNCIDNSYGPITAMNYLNEVTKDWDKVSKLAELYDDEGGHFKNFKISGYARLPKVNEVITAGCGTEPQEVSCPAWLFLGAHDDGGYWLLSSCEDDWYNSWWVSRRGYASAYGINADAGFTGVRPVITLEI